ncbi:hypothetical protein MNEG_13270 [Monoraphidium neglectum]|jgi:hypothetical protein|uniref:Uncharacterized protein n=1 Tax=Monoraphidium neglectum TaxID=145388 RepID=A0A0D2LZ84_9CHLO|nr:hypothetical protein MNEG_13270 [Monoraphidium neglectum]KIY94691.1 hypothetical protein MNEG_13270 [Monoraphidium neglectum]|eukprot:XP_013893711.1 hypothetical protein MNEG_13270 [Monoraphidium neglectum]
MKASSDSKIQLSPVQAKASAQAFTAGLAAASGRPARPPPPAAAAGAPQAKPAPSRRLLLQGGAAGAAGVKALTPGQAYAQLVSGAAALASASVAAAPLNAPPVPAGDAGVCVAAALRRAGMMGGLRVPLGCSGVPRPAEVRGAFEVGT